MDLSDRAPSTFCAPVTEHVSLHSKPLRKIMHVRLGDANNMHPLSWGHKRKRFHGKYTIMGGTNGKDPYHDWGAIDYLTIKLGGGGGGWAIMGKTPNSKRRQANKLTSIRSSSGI